MPSAEALVIDASALVEGLLGTEIGLAVRAHLRGHELHAPAHLDAEVLSALGRLHRAGEIDPDTASTAIDQLQVAPIQRHPLAGLLQAAWKRREDLRLVDGLYVELAATLDSIPLITTDARLARAESRAELVSQSS